MPLIPTSASAMAFFASFRFQVLFKSEEGTSIRGTFPARETNHLILYRHDARETLGSAD
jgi:hypothetical protein